VSGFADPKDAYSHAVTEGEPDSLIAGMVSAITGDLYLSDTDLLIQGYVPLRLPRTYISGNGKGKRSGWSFIDHLAAVYDVGNEDAKYHTITVHDPQGSAFIYRGVTEHVEKRLGRDGHPTIFRFSPDDTIGLTNTSTGELSAHSNFHNARITLDPKANAFTLNCPDGTIREYRIHKKHHHSYKNVVKGKRKNKSAMKYLLRSETLATGHKIIYEYDSQDRLRKVSSTSLSGTKTYSCAEFHFHHVHAYNNPDVDIFTSDGRHLEYRFESKGDDAFALTRVRSPEAPEEAIFYHSHQSRSGPLISCIAVARDHYTNVEYYRVGHNNICGDDVKLNDWKDPRFLRVSMLKAPVGTDATPHVTHRFFYYPEKRHTDVREIDNALLRYTYTPDMRLETVQRFTRGDQLQCWEKYSWTPQGELLSRTFYYTPHDILFSRSFNYDERGNVTQERLTGNLSGKGKEEAYVLKRTYSTDGRELLLSEREQNGKSTLYRYYPNTSLLEAQFICQGDQIKVRTFYEYNADHVLIKEISDDGVSPNQNDILYLKTRKIKVITPYPSGPFVDLPYIVEEKMWDGQEEVLLNKTVLTYTTGGLIAQKDIYDTANTFQYSLTFQYDDLGRLKQETNALGQTAIYDYDAAGNRIFAQDFSGKRSLHMNYDHSNRLIQSKEIGADGLEHVTQYQYDGKHRKTASIDHYGNTTRYFYDFFGNLEATLLSPVLNENGDPIEPTLRSSFDGAGREISRTDARDNDTRTSYNSRGQITQVTHPDGAQEKFVYNLDGTLQTHFDQEGNKTEYAYDCFGRKTLETDPLGNVTTYIYDALHLISVIDAEGFSTSYDYDPAGRKISEERQGDTTQFSYDTLGRLSSVKTGNLITITEYDLLDRKIKEREEDVKGNLYTEVSYGYDEAGNQTSITRNILGQEATEHFIYDALNRLILTIDPQGNETHISYNEDYINILNQRVLQKTTTDALGLQTIETYDAQGRLVNTEIQNASGITLSLEMQFYDANGNRARQESTIFPSKKQVTTLWKYDTMNRLETLIEAAGTEHAKTTQYTYSPKGQEQERIKPDGVILKRTYDSDGNLITLTSSDGTIAYTYTYNTLNQLVQSYDALSYTSTMRTLDDKGRILEEKLANRLTLKNQYDPCNRRTCLTLPDRSTIRYQYDPAFLREVNRHNTSGWILYSHAYTGYDLSGNLYSEQLIGKLGEVSLTTDSLGRQVEIASPFFSQQITAFDSVGNVLEMQTQEETTTYSYDDLYQISQEEGLFPHTYLYDSHYNRLQKDEETYTLNALNQLSDITYDPNGNPILIGNTTYTYDALDRLISLQTPTTRLTFTYDSFHRRLSKTVETYIDGTWHPTEPLLFLYDGQKEIGATDSSLEIIQLRVLGNTPDAEIGAAVAHELNRRIFAPLHDLFGNVACLIALDDQTQETYRYDAFGNSALFSTASTSFQNPWTFSSKRFDQESGHIYYGRRYYDPLSGRWLTPDPLGFHDGMNLYAFVHNNPLNTIDLYGLSSVPLDHMTGLPGPVQQTTWTGNKDLVINPTWVGNKGLIIDPPKVGVTEVAMDPPSNPHPPRATARSSQPSHLKSAGCAPIHFLGNSAITFGAGVANMGKLSSLPFYLISGQWSRFEREWNELQKSNSSWRNLWEQQMAALIPKDQRTDYYPWIVNIGEDVVDAAFLAATLGYGVFSKAAQFTGLLPKKTIQLNRFNQAASELSEVGQNNIRILRGWAKSKGWEKLPNSQGAPETWGSFNASTNKQQWNLKIKPEASLREGLDINSNVPRAAARYKEGIYVNPFTNESGGGSVGKHISLETLYK
jgi:RHS repeat-associated protein